MIRVFLLHEANRSSKFIRNHDILVQGNNIEVTNMPIVNFTVLFVL